MITEIVTDPATIDACWDDIGAWFTPTLICSAADGIPSAAWVAQAVATTHRTLLVARDDDGTCAGFVLFLPDARVEWMALRPADFADALRAVAAGVHAATGAPSWGHVPDQTFRDAILAVDHTLVEREPYPSGSVVQWAGAG